MRDRTWPVRGRRRRATLRRHAFDRSLIVRDRQSQKRIVVGQAGLAVFLFRGVGVFVLHTRNVQRKPQIEHLIVVQVRERLAETRVSLGQQSDLARHEIDARRNRLARPGAVAPRQEVQHGAERRARRNDGRGKLHAFLSPRREVLLVRFVGKELALADGRGVAGDEFESIRRVMGVVGVERIAERPPVADDELERRLRSGKVRADDADRRIRRMADVGHDLEGFVKRLLVNAAHRRFADEEHHAQSRRIDLLRLVVAVPEQEHARLGHAQIARRFARLRLRFSIQFPRQPAAVEDVAVLLLDGSLNGVDDLIERVAVRASRSGPARWRSGTRSCSRGYCREFRRPASACHGRASVL